MRRASIAVWLLLVLAMPETKLAAQNLCYTSPPCNKYKQVPPKGGLTFYGCRVRAVCCNCGAILTPYMDVTILPYTCANQVNVHAFGQFKASSVRSEVDSNGTLVGGGPWSNVAYEEQTWSGGDSTVNPFFQPDC